MPVKFYNVKTGEVRTADTEPHISALFNSSNMGPNALVGQDFGWRLAPETIAEIRKIKKNPTLMSEIAATFQLPQDVIKDTDIVTWISREDARKQDEANETNESDYTREYEDQVRALDNEDRLKRDPNPSEPGTVPQQLHPERSVEDVMREDEERKQQRTQESLAAAEDEDTSSYQDLLDDDETETQPEPEAAPEPPAQPEKSKSQQRREAAQSENKSKK